MRLLTILLIGLTIFSCTTEEDIDISKYPLITTVEELSEYYDLSVDLSGKYEASRITKYFDGSVELEYTYDLIETEEYDPLFYSVTIQKERTNKDAMEVYLLGKGALLVVGNTFEQGVIEIDSLELPGDQSFYALRTYDGEPNGIFYTVREGKIIYTLIISGLYFEDHSIILDLVLPTIENLESFSLVE